MNYFYKYKSKIGDMLIKADESLKYITHFLYADKTEDYEIIKKDMPFIVLSLIKEMDEYFQKKITVFKTPILLDGTDFQKAVWKETMKIKYGDTKTYKDIAVSIRKEKASRAVGSAEGANKINIIMPCHRVLGSSGNLAGYGGGIERKEYLLNLEKQAK